MTGLFGGSYDPIHLGHLVTARTLLEAYQLDEMRFVVAREQPLKGSHGAEARHRARMVELAIEGEPQFRLERCELEREGPSYTVDTLRHLSEREPHLQWTIFLGSDAARDLDRWKDVAEVARMARIIVFGRAGQAIPASPYVSEAATVPCIDISATQVRDRVRRGLPIGHLVPPAVAGYIAENRLYY